jgi:hypothetical protein
MLRTVPTTDRGFEHANWVITSRAYRVGSVTLAMGMPLSATVSTANRGRQQPECSTFDRGFHNRRRERNWFRYATMVTPFGGSPRTAP